MMEFIIGACIGSAITAFIALLLVMHDFWVPTTEEDVAILKEKNRHNECQSINRMVAVGRLPRVDLCREDE